MLKLYSCTVGSVKNRIDKEAQNPQSPFDIWKGFLCAKLQKNKTLANVYYYAKLPDKMNEFYYVKRIK